MSVSSPSFLFINVSRIGDTLFATPAMRAVEKAHPGSRMVALGHPKRTEILSGLSFLKDVGAITKRGALWRGWFGARRYDHAVVYVGVDTGPTHLMSTFDIPLVGFYHCISSSKLTGPADHPCFYAVDHPRTERSMYRADGDGGDLGRVGIGAGATSPRRALRPRPQAATRFA